MPGSSGVLHFVMKLSKLCNLRCSYCYEYDQLGEPARMPLDRVEFFLSTLADSLACTVDPPRVRFVLHGGEPLLLPLDYLDAFCGLVERHLGERRLPYSISLQTNLLRLDDGILGLLGRRRIALGVSFDVFGGQRVNLAGRDSQTRVAQNMQRLLDDGLHFGGIAVVHALNVDALPYIYRFYRQLGVSMRFLPMFARTEAGEERTAHLIPAVHDVVAALCELADEVLEDAHLIGVKPIDDYCHAAARKLAGRPGRLYDPLGRHEWTVIVDVDGGAYNHGDAYTDAGLIGNIFEAPWDELMRGPRRMAMHARRMARAATCRACPFDLCCSQLPVVEAYQSQQVCDSDGRAICTIARPVIEHVASRMETRPALVERYLRPRIQLPVLRIGDA